ncbi:MAG: SDR family oxidoreductase [Acidobacteriota bacterium]|nr:SDR family oxidoreductase [Acidobacteriota bacterium]
MAHHPSDVQHKKIFLTGASGVVGRALLSRMESHSVVSLVRPTTKSVPTTATVVGDISLPRFGLSSEQFSDLAKRIDCIVHAAAVTDFGSPDELLLRTNVDGLNSVLELAATADVPLYHISTAFVRPVQAGGTGCREPAYAFSKREGERRVRQSGLRSVIIRPSIVIGDSESGRIARFQGIHSVIGAVMNGFMPLLPASPHAYIDCIPQDTLAEAILALIEDGRDSGEYWITAGTRSLTIGRIGEIVKEFTSRIGSSFSLPRFVSADMVDRLLRPAFMSALPPALCKRFERLLEISAYLCIDDPFATSLPDLQSCLNLRPLPDLETAFARGLAYWADATGYTARRATTRGAGDEGR